jgi:hypothetical protein
MTYELHPLCTLFPRLGVAEFDALVADVKANGLRQPITLHGGMILDGGNRYRACLEAGVQPTFEQFAGDSLVAFVLSANLHRRHLSPGQQAAIVASAQDWAKTQPVGKPKLANVGQLATVEQRAAQSGASRNTQKAADKVARADPALARKVAHGEVSLPKAVAQVEGKPAAKATPKAAPPTTTPPDDDDLGVDAADLLDDMRRDKEHAEATAAEFERAMKADDGKAKLAELIRRLEHAQRRQDELMEDAARWQKRAVRYERLLAQCGKAVGQPDLDQVVGAVRTMAKAARAPA